MDMTIRWVTVCWGGGLV